MDYVIGWARGKEGRGEGARYLIDTYCGSGLFALNAGRVFEKVVGIELNDKAIDEARENAELNGMNNVEFAKGTAENIFSDEQVRQGAKPARKLVVLCAVAYLFVASTQLNSTHLR